MHLQNTFINTNLIGNIFNIRVSIDNDLLVFYTDEVGSKISHFLKNWVMIFDQLLLLLQLKHLLKRKYNKGVKGAYQDLSSKYAGKNFKQNFE